MAKTKAKEIEEAIAPMLGDGDYVFIVAGDGSHFTHFSKPFQLAYQQGTLTPENTFPLVIAAYGYLQVALAMLDDTMQGHMATCMPKEFRQMVEDRIKMAQEQATSGLILPEHLRKKGPTPS